MNESMRVLIASDQDIVTARQKGRTLASSLGFLATDATLIATAISELARNIVTYAKKGELSIRSVETRSQQGIMIVAKDEGPGIQNIESALRDGYSTSGSLGLGLPGVKRLMDEFEIVSVVGVGTTVTVKKWKN